MSKPLRIDPISPFTRHTQFSTRPIGIDCGITIINVYVAITNALSLRLPSYALSQQATTSSSELEIAPACRQSGDRRCYATSQTKDTEITISMIARQPLAMTRGLELEAASDGATEADGPEVAAASLVTAPASDAVEDWTDEVVLDVRALDDAELPHCTEAVVVAAVLTLPDGVAVPIVE